MKRFLKLIKWVLLSISLLTLLVAVLFGHRDIPLNELKSKYANAASSFISVDGMDVHVRDEGNKADSIPLVLIHGTGASLHTFDGWAATLQKTHRVIRMDLPAYGLTGPFPDQDYSMDHYAAFIKHLLSALGIEKCVIGGNSLGGGIAWNFTLQNPATVDKLILIDAAGYPTKSKSIPIAFQMARIPILNNIFTYITPRFIVNASVKNVYADKTKVSETLVDRYFELSLRKGNRQAFIDRIGMIQNPNTHLKIKQIQQPTLILWGAEDLLIPVEQAYQFQKDLPNDTLVIMKEVGHVPMEERPDKSVEIVESFLNSPITK